MDNREHDGSTPTDNDAPAAITDAPPHEGPDPETLAEALAAHDAIAEASAEAVDEVASDTVGVAVATVGLVSADAASGVSADGASDVLADGASDVSAHAGADTLAEAIADGPANDNAEPPAEAAVAVPTDTGAEPLAETVADGPADDGAAERPEVPTLDEAVEDAETSDDLSPAVRRLVRQYDVDIRKIQGSGPYGRIRVADVMAYLGGRTYVPEQPAQPEPPRESRAPAQDEDRRAASRPARDSAPAPHPRAEPEPVTLAPVTTVFECDLGAVLAHRKQLRQRNVDVVLTSYFLVAASEALRAVPEAAEGHEPVRIGAVLTFAEGRIQTAMVDAPDGSAFESLQDRLLAVDKEFRFSARSAELNPRLIDLIVHHHGASGSIVTTPTPIGEGHAASIGVGKVRREIVVGGGEDDVAPRIAARCYVSLSFYPDRLELARANRFMAQLVRVLEQWPAA
ncbi:MAG TPA: E3 binding domain-containing protein [Gammaproteobacteria bacterium]